MNDARVTRYLAAGVRRYTEEDLVRYIGAMNADPANRLIGLFRRDDGRHLGNIRLGPIDAAHRRCFLGIVIGDPAAWGQGFAREAIATATAHAFDSLGLHRVVAGCVAANAGSLKAFLAAGYVLEGRRRDHYWIDGRWDDELLMGRVRDGDAARDSASQESASW